MTELELCPFCGVEADIGYVDGIWWVISCLNCPAEMRMTQRTKEEVVALWNKRFKGDGYLK